MGLQTYDEKYPFTGQYQFLAADGTSAKTVLSGHTTPVRIDAIVAVTNEAGAHNYWIEVGPSGSTRRLGAGIIPAGSGVAGSKGIELLALVLPVTVAGVVLPVGWVLNIGLDVAVTGSNFIHVTAMGGYLA